MKPFKVFAPAKVNLFLQVLRKRPDGFHEIDTIFEALNVGDYLTFEPASSRISLTCNLKTLPTGPKNLVYQAANLLKERYGITQGIKIHLDKQLPVASGMGGGSSDAASTLLALNRLWKLKLSQKTLLQHAAELGSDIPFFILQSPLALGKGRGEQLKALKTHTKLWHILITPKLKVMAKDMYQALTPNLLTQSGANARMLQLAVLKDNYEGITSGLFNTLGLVLLKKKRIIRTIQEDLLKSGADSAMVSGSGPTVFGLAKNKQHAEKVAKKLKKLHPSKFIKVASTHKFLQKI